MPIIILIPAAICIIAFFRMSVQKTFLNVYLPAMLLLPVYYFWKVAALPPIDFAEAMLFPLGIAIVLKEIRYWRFSTGDLWMGLFIFTSYYADYQSGHDTVWKFELFANFCLALVPYMAGKLLIEQKGARSATVKRAVFILFVVCILSAYEYRFGRNPFMMFWDHFFPGETFAWKTQIRWGFGRISGPYAQSELAGMMFSAGLIFTLWLTYTKQWEPKFARALWLPLKKSTIIAWTLGIAIFMTQARGPWLGVLLALPIALIGRAKNVARATLIVGVIAVVVGPLAYIGFRHYIDAAPSSDEQQTAQYRQHLLDNYRPLAEQGGAWGWGYDFPRNPGEGSVDNEYLFLTLTQGWVGLLAFSLLALDVIAGLVWAVVWRRERDDRYFAFTMLGVFVGLVFTLFTVYLGEQPFQLFFLLAGWSQALRMRPRPAHQPALVQVYT